MVIYLAMCPVTLSATLEEGFWAWVTGLRVGNGILDVEVMAKMALVRSEMRRK